ncbi:MAG TPA: isoprenylcysteine carboxylmethyltransferase family protein [Candidatus Dormibacteraeota bacterium]|jgi:protein-S-isoprenylcysteine O-methyltransferase Ste14|nr:isoprenylcysteine carboxylmethyltransferase family protein [Candidatus Dormibacteraeota bacterium]
MQVAAGTPQAVASGRAARRESRAAYWAGIRFLLFGRTVPAALFGLMGWIQLNKLILAIQTVPASPTLGRVAGTIVSPALYTAFCSIPVVLYLTRPRPRARDGRLVARMAAFSGTTMQLLVGAFIGAGPLIFSPPPLMSDASSVLAVVAFTGAVWGLGTLRRSLSVMPEARRLVTGGPYRFVRHPLYLFEILAGLAILLGAPGWIAAGSYAAFVALQIVRARLEERLLGATFPDYDEYARRTRRLIPLVW